MLDALRELQTVPQWVCYRKTPTGKVEKIPVSPRTGKNAAVNRPTTWSTYAKAVEAMGRFENIVGVGLVITEADQYVGIDFDDCIEDGVITPDVQKWIVHFNSYAEITPSGTGIRIWVRGVMQKSLTPKKLIDHVEAYGEGRWFTVTGNHVPGTPEDIGDRQTELDVLFANVETMREEKKKTNNALLKKIGELKGIPVGSGQNPALAEAAYLAGICIVEHSFITRAVLDAFEDVLGVWSAGGEYNEAKTRDTLTRCMTNGVEDAQAGKTTKKKKKERRESPHFGDGKKWGDIIINEQKDVNLQQVLDSLHWLNKQDGPRIFAHGATVVQFGLSPDMLNPVIKRPSLFPLEQNSLTNIMSEAADYFRDTPNGPQDNYPPPALANGILAMTPHKRNFPPVKAVVEAPTFRRDGSLITEEGYDELSGYYYHPSHEMRGIQIPCKPTKDDVIAARNVLWRVFGEFPYVSDADRANNFAFGLTPFIRPFIDSLAPMCYTEASIPGSGKGLNTDCWSLIATGQVAAKCSAVDNTELEKRIFALLGSGRVLICVDNVRGKLESKALEAALTAELYEDRTLGKTEVRQVPNLATWCCNGNNATLGGDLPRRCYRVRFTPDTAQPWLNKFSIDDLCGYVREHRVELVQACLTIIQGWLVADRPAGDPGVLPLGSYGTWTNTMNGILTYAGIDGFLGNMQEFYEENNDEAQQLTTFFEKCMDTYKGIAVTTQKIVDGILDKSGSGKPSVLFESLPPDMQALADDKDITPKMLAKERGYKLRKYKDRPFGSSGCRVVRANTQGHTHRAEWRFVNTVQRNLTSWDSQNAYHAHNAYHDSLPRNLQKSNNNNISQGHIKINTHVSVDSNDEKYSTHDAHGTQNAKDSDPNNENIDKKLLTKPRKVSKRHRPRTVPDHIDIDVHKVGTSRTEEQMKELDAFVAAAVAKPLYDGPISEEDKRELNAWRNGGYRPYGRKRTS